MNPVSNIVLTFLKILCRFFSTIGEATLAQLVEQLIRNEQVVGSNPTGGSVYLMDAPIEQDRAAG